MCKNRSLRCVIQIASLILGWAGASGIHILDGRLAWAGDGAWEMTSASVQEDWFGSVIRSGTGSWFAAGARVVDSDLGLADIYLAELGPEGGLAWEATIDVDRFDEAFDVSTSRDGHLLVTGSTGGNGRCGLDCASAVAGEMFILQTTRQGKVSWLRRVERGSLVVGRGIAVSDTGELAIVGQCRAIDVRTGDDVYVGRFDSAGIPLWERTYGGLKNDIGYAIANAPNGGLVVAGKTASFGRGETDMYILRLSEAGELVWERTFGEHRSDAALGICNVSSGGFLSVGFVQDGNSDVDVAALRLNDEGDLLWLRQFGSERIDIGYSVSEIACSEYVIGGQSNLAETRPYIVGIDDGGGGRWERFMSNQCAIFSVDATDATSCVFVGQCRKSNGIGGEYLNWYAGGFSPQSLFIRGDANLDARVNIADPVFMLGGLFLGGTEMPCPDSSDVNDDGIINLTDPVYLLNYLFRGGVALPLPFPFAGEDLTDDPLLSCTRRCL